MTTQSAFGAEGQHPPSSRITPTVLWQGALLTFVVLLVCLVPKPENDLFFELRIGTDILHTHHLPHVDTYSWVCRGKRWDVPEWGAFCLYALAYQAGAFAGTWILMAILTWLTAVTVWLWLRNSLGPIAALILTVLALLGMSPTIQERPYAFTYLLLPLSLIIVTRARQGPLQQLLWLLPLCVLWTNLHQGVVVLLCLLAIYALADGTTALVHARQGASETARRFAAQASALLGAAVACTAAATVSPYGWRVFWNVFITLRDHQLMTSVTEWNSIAVLPPAELPPFLLLAALLVAGFVLHRKRDLGSMLALTALFIEALLHARNIALFALTGVIIGAPYYAAALRELQTRLPLLGALARHRMLLGGFAVVYAVVLSLITLAGLGRDTGPRGLSLEGIGEAVARVPAFPADACAFVQHENFPPNLHLLNNFEIGGFLMWRLPTEPVFADGRLDVYAGRTFDDMLLLARPAVGSPSWAALVKHYGFDCVFTTSAREAAPFLADPSWQLVYLDPKRPQHQRCRILVRRTPALMPLITRCLNDRGAPSVGSSSPGVGTESRSEAPPPQFWGAG